MPAQSQDPQDDLLARQAQIAAKAGGSTPVSSGSFPTEPDNRVQVGDQVKSEEKMPPKNPVEPVKPSESVQSVQSVEPAKSVEPPKESATPAPSVAIGEVGNPNAILELTKADIFKLLGMSQVPEIEKKKNLDEMEETIWQDFVEEDLPKMLKPDEKGKFEDLLKTAPSAEKVINFFGSPPSGGLPADFEEKYLAKTLEFKAEIAKEQIETLLESVDDPPKKATLQKAKDLAAAGFWKQVEDLMVAFG